MLNKRNPKKRDIYSDHFSQLKKKQNEKMQISHRIYSITTILSISTRAFFGNSATPTVDRAGNGD